MLDKPESNMTTKGQDKWMKDKTIGDREPRVGQDGKKAFVKGI